MNGQLRVILYCRGKMVEQRARMRYLWKSPVQLDDSKLVAFLGNKPYTPIEEALRTTSIGTGCMPAPNRAVAVKSFA